MSVELTDLELQGFFTNHDPAGLLRRMKEMGAFDPSPPLVDEAERVGSMRTTLAWQLLRLSFDVMARVADGLTAIGSANPGAVTLLCPQDSTFVWPPGSHSYSPRVFMAGAEIPWWDSLRHCQLHPGSPLGLIYVGVLCELDNPMSNRAVVKLRSRPGGLPPALMAANNCGFWRGAAVWDDGSTGPSICDQTNTAFAPILGEGGLIQLARGLAGRVDGPFCGLAGLFAAWERGQRALMPVST